MEKYFQDSIDEAVATLKDNNIYLEVVKKLSRESLFTQVEIDIQSMKASLAFSQTILIGQSAESLMLSYESLFAFGMIMSAGTTDVIVMSAALNFDYFMNPYLLELKDLMIRKQKDYGKSNILKFGHIGLMVRMSDKIERIKNLMTNGKTPQNESLDDSFRDIINYAIIGTMLLQGTFERPLKEDNT